MAIKKNIQIDVNDDPESASIQFTYNKAAPPGQRLLCKVGLVDYSGHHVDNVDVPVLTALTPQERSGLIAVLSKLGDAATAGDDFEVTP